MKPETLMIVAEHVHGYAVSMNDTFYYACADSACIDADEMNDLEPVIELYGRMAFVAYEAIKRGHDPQVRGYADHPDFIAAKQLITNMMATAEEYGVFFELRETVVELKALAPQERKKVSKSLTKAKEWFSFFTGR